MFLKPYELTEMINKLELYAKRCQSYMLKRLYGAVIELLKLILEQDCNKLYDEKL